MDDLDQAIARVHGLIGEMCEDKIRHRSIIAALAQALAESIRTLPMSRHEASEIVAVVRDMVLR